MNYFTGEGINKKLRTRPRIYVDPSAPKTDSGPIVKAKVQNVRELERRAFDLLNQKRMEFGLTPVVWSDEVARIARIHSTNMARFNFFSHQGLDGLMVNDRAEMSGLKDWRRIGENIAYNRGYDDPVESAVVGWMKSASHRQNLLSNKWKESGVGVALAPDGKTYYFTQVFVLRK
ncbi:MAG: CAP domain-containing protein [Pyrinomonadaceae bacterium]